MEQPKVPITKILTCTDFSETAAAAFAQARWLAECCGAKLTLAHVLADVRSAVCDMPADSRWQLAAGDIEQFERSLRGRSDEQLEQQIAPYRGGPVAIEHMTLLGTPFVEIIHAVQQEGYDLVMAGTRGVSAIKKFFLGSTAERLVRMSPCPVWVVKPESTPGVRSILAPVDFSEASGKALKLAAAMAAQCRTKLHILHVYDLPFDRTALDPEGGSTSRRDQQEAKQIADGRLAELVRTHVPESLERDVQLVRGEAWRAIDSTARRLDADLIVMGTVGRSGIPGLLLGNTAEKVLRGVNRSVLVTKPDGFVCPIQPPFWPLHPKAETPVAEKPA